MTIKRIQKGYGQEYAIESPPLSIDLETFLFKNCKKYIIKTLNTKLTKLKAVKCSVQLRSNALYCFAAAVEVTLGKGGIPGYPQALIIIGIFQNNA